MKLKFRLPLFFLLVIILGASTTVFLVRNSTDAMFRSFVFSGDSDKAKVYATMLGDYYQTKGSWNDVQPFLQEIPLLVSQMIKTTIHGSQDNDFFYTNSATALRTLMADRVVIANMDGVIIADTANQILGTVHSYMHLSHGIPVMSQFEQKGTVLVGSMIDSSLTGIAERFLRSITVTLLYSTGISILIALVLGFLFTFQIIKPLAVLAKAARTVASGDLSGYVTVQGKDELSDLSISFNEMTLALKRLDAAKKQIVADSAHELRTPVSLIQGTIEGMIDGIFPLDIRTLKSVHEETIRLSKLIDTLRELEIIESGELRLSRESVILGDMLENAVALFASAASSKGIRLLAENRSGERSAADVDRLRVGEVLYNLISNAINYTPEGGTVRIREERGTPDEVQFSVDDSGPGIPPAERELVFQRFYRIDKSRASNSGGRGLGLAIASEIAKAHGGKITVGASDLGGAGFTVVLPRARD